MQKEYLKAFLLILFSFWVMGAAGSEKRSHASFAAEITNADALHISIEPGGYSACAVMDVYVNPVKIGKHFVTLFHQYGNFRCPGITPVTSGPSYVVASSLFKYCQKLLIYPFHGFW